MSYADKFAFVLLLTVGVSAFAAPPSLVVDRINEPVAVEGAKEIPLEEYGAQLSRSCSSVDSTACSSTREVTDEVILLQVILTGSAEPQVAGQRRICEIAATVDYDESEQGVNRRPVAFGIVDNGSETVVVDMPRPIRLIPGQEVAVFLTPSAGSDSGTCNGSAHFLGAQP